jgi:DUF1680 family protein
MKLILLSLLMIPLSLFSQNKVNEWASQVNDELQTRIKMASERLVFGKEPEITEDFILAGVTLDPKFPVRFSEYSGDQAGRYLSTFSRIQVMGNPVNLDELVKKIIATQKPDGRFGDATLVFDPNQLTGNHMALLWGNGRLLTGLMDYYTVSKKTEALEAAKKLGKFLTDVAESCSRPEVIEKFKTMGAMGYICFTQITDGLVKLYSQTSDPKYLSLAGKMYKLLPAFGNQHSHGFLNTVLGVVGLYNATKDTTQLNFAENIYRQIINSPDYLITGGVPEFFGNHSSGDGYRDEGCSEADFVMLSIELWKATGKMDYLDKAEYCLFNELMYNQYCSGDFGSHPIDKNFGFVIAHSQGRAWWCCDFHGLQAMIEARNIIVTNKNGTTLVNIYSPVRTRNSELAFTLKKPDKDQSAYELVIDSCGKTEQTIAFRTPLWSNQTNLRINGKDVVVKPENGYIYLKQTWKKGDVVSISLNYKLQIVSFDHTIMDVASMPSKLEKAAIQYGPYLLSVDDVFSTPFLAEPSGGNIIFLLEKELMAGKITRAKAPKESNLGEAYLEMNYKHDGYYKIGKVTLRPVSEVTHGQLPNVELWFNFDKK